MERDVASLLAATETQPTSEGALVALATWGIEAHEQDPEVLWTAGVSPRRRALHLASERAIAHPSLTEIVLGYAATSRHSPSRSRPIHARRPRF